VRLVHLGDEVLRAEIKKNEDLMLKRMRTQHASDDRDCWMRISCWIRARLSGSGACSALTTYWQFEESVARKRVPKPPSASFNCSVTLKPWICIGPDGAPLARLEDNARFIDDTRSGKLATSRCGCRVARGRRL
jgi:hypothetical protein